MAEGILGDAELRDAARTRPPIQDVDVEPGRVSTQCTPPQGPQVGSETGSPPAYALIRSS
jgi:hypothetical protein